MTVGSNWPESRSGSVKTTGSGPALLHPVSPFKVCKMCPQPNPPIIEADQSVLNSEAHFRAGIHK